jgi:hypothetical protein
MRIKAEGQPQLIQCLDINPFNYSPHSSQLFFRSCDSVGKLCTFPNHLVLLKLGSPVIHSVKVSPYKFELIVPASLWVFLFLHARKPAAPPNVVSLVRGNAAPWSAADVSCHIQHTNFLAYHHLIPELPDPVISTLFPFLKDNHSLLLWLVASFKLWVVIWIVCLAWSNWFLQEVICSCKVVRWVCATYLMLDRICLGSMSERVCFTSRLIIQSEIWTLFLFLAIAHKNYLLFCLFSRTICWNSVSFISRLFPPHRSSSLSKSSIPFLVSLRRIC